MPTTNPTIHEHQHRARKAVLLAETLAYLDCDSEAAAVLDDNGWTAAAKIACVAEPSTTTRSAVVAILADREAHPDPFDAFVGVGW